MPDNKPKNDASDDVADYSSYFKKDEPVQKKSEPTKPVSPLQEMPVSKRFTKRAMILLIILVALIVTQIVLMINWNKTTAPAVPDGYRLITPPNQPAYIEKIK